MFDLPPAYESLKDVYDQLPDEAKNQIKAIASLSPVGSVRFMLLKAVHQRTSDPAFQDQLLEEVDVLANNVLQLEQAFESIKVKLGTDKDLDGKPSMNYQATWEEYQKRWTKFLGRSRETAGETEKYIAAFLDVILPLVENVTTGAEPGSIEETVKALDIFSRHENLALKWLDFDETHKYSKEFIGLKSDLDAFIDGFGDFAKAQNVTFTDAINAKKAEIATVRTEIAKSYSGEFCWFCNAETLLNYLESKIMGLERGMAVTVYKVETDSALLGARCGVLAPVTGHSIVVASINSVVAEASAINAEYAKLQEYKRKEDTLNRELTSLEQGLLGLPSVASALENHKFTFKDVGGRMDQLATLWGTAIRHSQSLLPFFKVDGNKLVISNVDVFKYHLGCVISYQKSMRAGLNRYVVKVTP